MGQVPRPAFSGQCWLSCSCDISKMRGSSVSTPLRILGRSCSFGSARKVLNEGGEGLVALVLLVMLVMGKDSLGVGWKPISLEEEQS